MIRILLTVVVLGAVGSFAGLAVAQVKQGEASGSGESSHCAHRKVMPPDPRDGCVRNLRSDVQLGSGQGSALVSSSSDGQASGVGPGNAGGPGNGIGPGNGGGPGNGIGPGSGSGQAKGRR